MENMKKRWCSCGGRQLREEDSGSSGCTGGGGGGGRGGDGVFEQQEEEGRLPGFRFHPTDEELVGFYLKRKVDKRPPLSIDIIKQVDIYKHDPWDLAKASSSVGDKEWYFYCKRGRKYRNSIRPNRVTGSGFWKATGIDRPIYSNNGGEPHKCIGLKKSLVYYRGTAGKGSKTDWMMHEFRLPTDLHNLSNPKDIAQEAEIWTLCRIFKRHKRHTPDWRELFAKKNTLNYTSSKTSSIDSDNNQEHYISFASQPRTTTNNNDHSDMTTIMSDQTMVLENHNINVISDQHQQQWSSMTYTPPSYSSSMNLQADDIENDLQSFPYYNTWDDLSSVVDFAVRTQFM